MQDDDLLSSIGGVLSYTVGADGAGSYCVIFRGTADEARAAACAYLKNIEQRCCKTVTALFVPNDTDYDSALIQVVTPTPGA